MPLSLAKASLPGGGDQLVPPRNGCQQIVAQLVSTLNCHLFIQLFAPLVFHIDCHLQTRVPLVTHTHC